MRAAFFDLGSRHRSPHFSRTLREAAARHRSDGDLVVLVLSCERPRGRPGDRPEAVSLDTLGVGADLVLLPDPLGPPAAPGDHPPVTVVEAITLLGMDPASCFGYVDHCDGLRTLSVVGNPRVVGVDPELTAHADSHGWPVLKETQEPAGRAGPPSSQ
ncbi:hypothetical protein [Kitasatospora sp. NBC_01266]|uniref:hypothetical protein n=1 Tax=Kitasatospora sp. NBC_01266 TaxID=2903572 RepID=UPI002E303D6E|nr:hypothetical protein [Kitasatospora sp. NBC_01266]